MTLPSFSLTAKANVQDEQTKQLLIDCMEKEKEQIAGFTNAFYSQARRTEASYIDLCHNVIDAVNRVLEAGDWESSLFLRNTIKPLKEIRSEAESILSELKQSQDEESFELPHVAEGRVELYVSLYQAEGHDLRKWALQLDSLSSYMVGRPVYAHEENVVNMIRRKSAQTSEAYVVVEVDKQKILSTSQNREDRLGSRLESLVEGAVSPADIREFVHMGQRFYFKNHRLIPKDKNKKAA